jgi:trimeric autotransporter adhesin
VRASFQVQSARPGHTRRVVRLIGSAQSEGGRWLQGPSVPGVDAAAGAIVVLPNGDAVVGGWFHAAGNAVATSIARFTRSTNAWAPLGAGVSGGVGVVWALAVLPNGDIVAGGSFTRAGNISVGYIARYSFVTESWAALGTGVNNFVTALAVLPNGDLIAGGGFTLAGTVNASNIARYNPATDTWFALGSGTNNPVNALAALQNGDVIVGGQFTAAGGAPVACGLARYSPTNNA